MDETDVRQENDEMEDAAVEEDSCEGPVSLACEIFLEWLLGHLML